MMRVWPILVAGVAASMVACGTTPRIDTTSDERAAASLEEVRHSLPPAKRPAFDEAVMTVVSSRFGEDEIRDVAAGPPGFEARALEPLNGMTAHEVLTEAGRIAAEKKEAGGKGPRGNDPGVDAAPPP
jgi:hypothetical protein